MEMEGVNRLQVQKRWEERVYCELEEILLKHLLETEIMGWKDLSQDEQHNMLLARLKKIERAREQGVKASSLFKLKRKRRKDERKKRKHRDISSDYERSSSEE